MKRKQRSFELTLFFPVAHWYDGHTGANYSPDSVSFLVFTSVWTLIIAVPYLALSPVYFPRFAHKLAILGLDALTMLFWFAGFIALAVFHSNLILCYGNVCNCMVAAIVFGAFEWYVIFFSERKNKGQAEWVQWGQECL